MLSKDEKYSRLMELYNTIKDSQVVPPETIRSLYDTLGLSEDPDVLILFSLDKASAFYKRITGVDAMMYISSLANLNPTVTSDVSNVCRSLLLSLIVEVMKPLL